MVAQGVAQVSAGRIVLTVDRLSVRYMVTHGAFDAVDRVSLTLNEGELFGLVGESGCGKSTLAYAIARLLRPPAYITGGQILYYPRYREDAVELREDVAAMLAPGDLLLTGGVTWRSPLPSRSVRG